VQRREKEERKSRDGGHYDNVVFVFFSVFEIRPSTLKRRCRAHRLGEDIQLEALCTPGALSRLEKEVWRHPRQRRQGKMGNSSSSTSKENANKYSMRAGSDS